MATKRYTVRKVSQFYGLFDGDKLLYEGERSLLSLDAKQFNAANAKNTPQELVDNALREDLRKAGSVSA